MVWWSRAVRGCSQRSEVVLKTCWRHGAETAVIRHSQQYGMTDVVWMCGKENDRVYTMLSRKAHLEDGYVLQCEAPRRYFFQVVQQARRALRLSPRGAAAIPSQHLRVLSACLESALRILLRMKT